MSKLNKKAPEFIPSKKTKLNKKAPEFIPRAKSSSKLNKKAAEFIPRSKSDTKIKKKVAEFVPKIVIPNKPKKLCPDYQHVCKYTKYGDVYRNKCSLQKPREENKGLALQAKKCLVLRIQHAKCRAEKGLATTPKHEYAIRKIFENLKDCKNITDMQKMAKQYQKLKGIK